MQKSELGAWGEQQAALYLQQQGYRIAARNYRCRMGEIDLIAQKDETLAFVEVKLRKDACHGEAREFVTASKQQKLILAARYYIMSHPQAEELSLRFDVAEVYAPQGAGGPCRIVHLTDAFTC
ncbi:MAG: YraN family protein [Oscillospiraceae bacterium]|nr:YraN family protein [Oscillospiraceae bacterium]